MIKANELRIGNWVCLPFGGNQQVTGRDIHELDALGAVGSVSLTPEILEKAGLVKQLLDGMDVYAIRLKNQFYNGIEYFGCEMQWHDDGSIFLADKKSGVAIPGKISYLHQLQNLYFALTGTELNIAL